MKAKSLVLFSHGKESGPWGSKIKYLANIAEQHGAIVLSPDYSGILDPDERLKMLLGMPLPEHDNLILVGSSMGGYVSTMATRTLRVRGLFLMAPAFYMPGYAVQDLAGVADHTAVVHGWNDEVIPIDHSIRFCQLQKADLHILDSDHRLNSVLPELGCIFDRFLLRNLSMPALLGNDPPSINLVPDSVSVIIP
jgi:pimeloyl-ACP methyl ester carboxylesterase